MYSTALISWKKASNPSPGNIEQLLGSICSANRASTAHAEGMESGNDEMLLGAKATTSGKDVAAPRHVVPDPCPLHSCRATGRKGSDDEPPLESRPLQLTKEGYASLQGPRRMRTQVFFLAFGVLTQADPP